MLRLIVPASSSRHASTRDFWRALAAFIAVTVTTFIVLSRPVRNGSRPLLASPKRSSAPRPGAGDDMLPPAPVLAAPRKPMSAPPRSVPDTRPSRLSREDGRASEDDGAALFRRAVAAVDRGAWQEAEILLTEFIAAHPRDEQALVELAMIQLVDKQDPEAARPWVERVLSVNPNNQTMQTELINVYQETGRLGEGLEFFRALADEHADSAAARYGVARTLYALGRTDEAIGELSVTAESGQATGYMLEDLGRYLGESGQTDRALETLEAAIHADVPGDPGGGLIDPAGREREMVLRSERMRLLMAAGRTEEAEAELSVIARLAPRGDERIAHLRDTLGQY